MTYQTFKKIILTLIAGISISQSDAQPLLPFRLPDTGQTNGYTSTKGEDADFIINPLSFTDNGDGTITDNNTLLMWQKTDGGEMTIENAATFCDNLALAGFTDWRLPTGIELFSINHYNCQHPALDTSLFTKTQAEYWWTSNIRADDPTKIWVVNAGGGIGAHPKTETISAGGTKYFHVRAVRNLVSRQVPATRFVDNGNGTIADNFTGLTWQKINSPNTMTWEEALVYANTLSLAGKTDWRLPNVKELQSLNDVSLSKPSFDNNFFTNVLSGNFWSSTTLLQSTTKAWDINVEYGIISYQEKTVKENVLLVRGGFDNDFLRITEATIPGGEYEMGDHNGHYDPSHPNDEIPVHAVYLDSFKMATTETTNQQYLAFLNSALQSGLIQVNNNKVHLSGDTATIFYTHQYAPYYSIGFDGSVFSIADFRANHPVVGSMWIGAATFCNWLSLQNGLQECFDTETWACDFSKNGYRLPTEAEWEYAARGGNTNPYLKYANGNQIDQSQTNLPNSGDPYETGSLPLSTPVGFYDGSLKVKSDYNWPGNATSYQTSDSKNGYGLYDVQGNAWEFVYDWYGSNYYENSPYNNPTGPATGSPMPDGKPYRAVRGGNWYNGIDSNNVNDGHSRVSNRCPSYFRGPQDPNHPWYHEGFRVARNYTAGATGINDGQGNIPTEIRLHQNFPNPFNACTTIQFDLKTAGYVKLEIFSSTGQLVAILADERLVSGIYTYRWKAENLPGGIYSCRLQFDNQVLISKMILIK